MPTFVQLLAEGFTVVLVAALLTGLLSIACAVAIDPVRPFGEAGADAATRFFTPPNERKTNESSERNHLDNSGRRRERSRNYGGPFKPRPDYVDCDLQGMFPGARDL